MTKERETCDLSVLIIH